MVRGKTTFTSDEFTKITTLVHQLEQADPKKQKNIRNKIRKIGLYWSEVANNKAYTVENLLLLKKDKTLKIIEI